MSCASVIILLAVRPYEYPRQISAFMTYLNTSAHSCNIYCSLLTESANLLVFPGNPLSSQPSCHKCSAGLDPPSTHTTSIYQHRTLPGEISREPLKQVFFGCLSRRHLVPGISMLAPGRFQTCSLSSPSGSFQGLSAFFHWWFILSSCTWFW
jgi:hypothetical protein